MKIKKAVIIILVLLIISGCSSDNKSVAKAYPEVDGEISCSFTSPDEVLSMLKHGTGVILFTWEGCPWCHRYIKYVNEIALKEDVDVLVYDIYSDREKGTDFYNEVCSILEPWLDETGAYDSDGKLRIYVPSLAVVSEGEIVAFDNQTSMISSAQDNIDEAIDSYWSSIGESGQPREYEFKKKLSIWFCRVCEAKKEIDGRGCSSCEVRRSKPLQ